MRGDLTRAGGPFQPPPLLLLTFDTPGLQGTQAAGVQGRARLQARPGCTLPVASLATH